MRLDALGERGMVARLLDIQRQAGSAEVGDDCGIVPLGDDYLLVSTDVIRPGVHAPSGTPPELLGWHLAAVNLSDIAAMGGHPLGLATAFTLPRGASVEDVEAIARGTAACATEFDTAVLAGDTKEGEETVLAATAVGRVPRNEILRRRGASAGDVVVATGAFGRAGAAVRAVEEGAGAAAVRDLLKIQPRIREGRLLAGSGAATSAMDCSDGLGVTLAEMATQSGVGFSVEWGKLPLAVDPNRPEAREHALYFGGDYELVATVRSNELENLQGAFNDAGLPLTAIGVATEAGPNVLRTESGTETLEARGWEHFR